MKSDIKPDKFNFYKKVRQLNRGRIPRDTDSDSDSDSEAEMVPNEPPALFEGALEIPVHGLHALFEMAQRIEQIFMDEQADEVPDEDPDQDPDQDQAEVDQGQGQIEDPIEELEREANENEMNNDE